MFRFPFALLFVIAFARIGSGRVNAVIIIVTPIFFMSPFITAHGIEVLVLEEIFVVL